MELIAEAYCPIQNGEVLHVQGWQKKSVSVCQLAELRKWSGGCLPPVGLIIHTETYCKIPIFCMRHENARQICSDLLIIHTLFPVVADNVARPQSPAT